MLSRAAQPRRDRPIISARCRCLPAKLSPRKAITPEGGLRNPRSCSLTDFAEAQVVVALKEAEHRPLIERRFPEVANRVIYWHVDDVGFVHPSIALAMIDDHVRELISTLK